MVTHSNILVWRIPWTEEPGSPWGHKRVEHFWVTKHSTAQLLLGARLGWEREILP